MGWVEIPLTPYGVALVDKADAGLVAGWTWRRLDGVTGLSYAHAERRHLHVYMHRLIMGAGPEEKVDHINRDGLDNRSSNLRIATSSENGANRIPDRRRNGKTSHYKGVAWDKSRNKWHAWVHHNGKTRGLGRFVDEDDAARAYNRAAVEVWGDFARLNIVPEES